MEWVLLSLKLRWAYISGLASVDANCSVESHRRDFEVLSVLSAWIYVFSPPVNPNLS